MPKETLTLSMEELGRLSVIEAVVDKRLRQREAAEQLGCCYRKLAAFFTIFNKGFDIAVQYRATLIS